MNLSARLTGITLLFFGLIASIFAVGQKTNLINHAASPDTTPTGVSGTNIQLVQSNVITAGSYKFYYWVFQNNAYPCGKSGYHQFMVIQEGASNDQRHLLVRHTGGFAGFFYPSGGQNSSLDYFPDSSFESLLDSSSYFQPNNISISGLDRLILLTNGWRIMAPSYCSHDFFLGTGQYNATDNFTRWGYAADSQAIDFTTRRFPTDKMVLYGTSAGSSGAFYQALSRDNVAGVVMDSFAVDLSSVVNACQKGVQPYYAQWPCTCAGQTCVQTVADRIGFKVGKEEPYLLVDNGRMTKPVLLIYDTNDYIYNGQVSLQFSRLANSLTQKNPGGKSKVDPVCVNDPSRPGTCNMHSPTLQNNSKAATDAYKWILSITQ